MSMIGSFLIKIYTVLVSVVHCCQNWLWLLYGRTPVLFCVDRLPCLRFRTHQSWFYDPESKHVLLCFSWIYISCFFYVPSSSFRKLYQSHLCSSRSSLRNYSCTQYWFVSQEVVCPLVMENLLLWMWFCCCSDAVSFEKSFQEFSWAINVGEDCVAGIVLQFDICRECTYTFFGWRHKFCSLVCLSQLHPEIFRECTYKFIGWWHEFCFPCLSLLNFVQKYIRIPITSEGVKRTIFLLSLAFVHVREMGCSV